MTRVSPFHTAICAVALALPPLLAVTSFASEAVAVGYLYSVNNDTQKNGVAVLEQNADGSLTEIAGSPFPTRGKGLGGGDIDQQGAIRVHGNYVLAVNPGSDSVAVFRKGDGGMLTPVAGSPFPSGGPAPLSLTIHGDLSMWQIKHRRSRTRRPPPTLPVFGWTAMGS